MQRKSSLAVGLVCAFCVVSIALKAAAQISFVGAQYDQDFNSLPASGTFTLSGNGPFNLSAAPIQAFGLSGWQFGKLTGSGANAVFRVDDGDGNTGSVYSYGLSAPDPNHGDRALGSLASGSVVSAFGAVFVNDSNSTFRNVTISFTGEQWRTTTAAANTLAFSYGVGANDIFDSADLIDDPSLNFTSVIVASDSQLNGNDPVNQANVSATIGGFDWAPSQRLVIRWADVNEGGSDHGLAIDNFRFNAFGTILVWNPSGGTPTSWNTTDADNWLDGVTPSAFTTGDTVVFSDVGAGIVNIDAGGVAPGSVRVEADNFYFFNGGANNSTGALTKEGIGTLTLQNANTFAADAIVNGGTLRLDGAGSLVAPAVVVNNSATLEGDGLVNSHVTINEGATLSPGVGIAAGTLTLGALTLESGSTTVFDLLVPGTGDRLQLTGIAGSSTVNGGSVRFRDAGGLAAGSYPIVQYSGAILGAGFGALTNETPFVGPWQVVLVDDSASGIVRAQVFLSGNKVWTGVAGSNWDTTSVNFRTNVPTSFSNGDVAQFDDTAVGTTDIFLPATVAPASVYIDNTDTTFTFSGAGIGGSGSLTKLGDGELYLNNANTYGDSTHLLGGTTVLGLPFALPLTTDVTVGEKATLVLNDHMQNVLALDGKGHIAIGATTLKISSGDDATFATNMSGTGLIEKHGDESWIFDTGGFRTPSKSTFQGVLAVHGGALNFAADEMTSDSFVARSALRASWLVLGQESTVHAGDELRIGNLAGAGQLLARSVTSDQGRRVIQHLTGESEYIGIFDNGFGPDDFTESRGDLVIRGVGSQTFSGGSTADPFDVAIFGDAMLRLTDEAAFEIYNVRLSLRGGSLVLDNSGVIRPNRLQHEDFNNDAVIRGHGGLALIGNASAEVTEAVGALQLTSAGTVAIIVDHRGGSATTLTLADITQSGGGNVNFISRGGTLGAAGAGPQVFINSFVDPANGPAAGDITRVNGLLGTAGTGPNIGVAGWAHVNDVDYATYSIDNGVAAFSGYVPFAAAIDTDNAILTAIDSIASLNTKVINSLKMNALSAGQTLTIESGASLATTAILQAGAPYEIAGAGNVFVNNATRQVHVAADRTLSISAPINSSGGNDPIVKSGDGVLLLSGTQTFTDDLRITGGVVRAQRGAGLPNNAVVEFRGGVLELSGPPSETTTNLRIGTGAGSVNWNNSDNTHASGGFSAFGGTRKIDLGDPGVSSITWESNNFVSGGNALILGSKTANSRLELIDNLNLSAVPQSGDTNYDLREINVPDNPNTPADFARLSGHLASSRYDDLLKTGAGTLEITNDNTTVNGGLNGGVIIGEGTLRVTHPGALGSAPYVQMGLRSGDSDTALLAGGAVSRDITIVAGNTGTATLGSFAAGAVTTFSGTVAVQNATSLLATGPVVLTGELLVEPGVLVQKRGIGMATVSGGHRLSSGSTIHVQEGTLRFLAGTEDRVRIGDNAVAAVDLGAVLELSGTKAALSDGAHYVNVSNAGILRITGANQAVGGIDLAGTVFVTAPGQLTASSVRQGLLSISGAGSRVSIRPNGGDTGASVLGGIEITLGGVFDLADNDLIHRATAFTKNAIHGAIESHILRAQNGVDANFITRWDGAGITSSAARSANVAANFDLTAIGVIRNSDLDITTGVPGATYTSFGGQTVSPHDVLVKYTYTGDGNLDGAVTFDDFAAMDAAFFGTIQNLGWATGDINFDNAINFDDYAVVDQAFFNQGAPLSGEAGAAAVPEPAAVMLLLCSVPLIVVNRRLKRA
jgi:autotransporter-associated beta strand protein